MEGACTEQTQLALNPGSGRAHIHALRSRDLSSQPEQHPSCYLGGLGGGGGVGGGVGGGGRLGLTGGAGFFAAFAAEGGACGAPLTQLIAKTSAHRHTSALADRVRRIIEPRPWLSVRACAKAGPLLMRGCWRKSAVRGTNVLPAVLQLTNLRNNNAA